jgi:hypothetical protein
MTHACKNRLRRFTDALRYEHGKLFIVPVLIFKCGQSYADGRNQRLLMVLNSSHSNTYVFMGKNTLMNLIVRSASQEIPCP